MPTDGLTRPGNRRASGFPGKALERILPLAILAAFSVYTVFVMVQAEQSLLQFGMQLMSRLDTAQVVIDL